MTSHEEYDLIIIGAGAAGLTAAAVAASLQKRVLLVEHASLIGGTTAISGGMVWIPANHKMIEAGIADTLIAANTYLDNTLPPEADRGLRDAFLASGDEMIRYLEAHTSARFRCVTTYPDYYPTRPGATAGGRVLEPVPFDGRELGKRFASLRPALPEFMLFGAMMVGRADIPHFRKALRSFKSFRRVTALVTDYLLQRLHAARGTTLYLGNALAARLFKSVLDLGVTIRSGVQVLRLVREDGRVIGIEATDAEGPRQWRARCAVILATGGISNDTTLRGHYVPAAAAGAVSATVNSQAGLSGARLAQAVGAQMRTPGTAGAFWVPGSQFKRADGSVRVYPHTVTDRAKPGLIAVDANARRFVNEALSYHEFGRAQLRAASTAIPAYLICDKNFLWKYGLGRIKPFALSVAADLRSGYLRSASTVAALAGVLGIPAPALVATVDVFNAGAVNGVDREFGRGGDIYQRSLGDAECQPNPCVAPIVAAPFYAVAVVPTDLGMSAGLRTDAMARVLDTAGAVIPGLYACGNDMDSCMAGAYPGPGITLGPALTFAYIAAKKACSG